MGNVVQTIIGSIVIFYIKISSNIKSYWNKDDENSNTYTAFRPNEIILKDDEESTGIYNHQINSLIK